MAKESLKKIESLQNPLVKHYVRLRQNKSYREKCQKAVVTGLKIVTELSAISPPISLCKTNNAPADFAPSCDTFLISEAILKKMTGVASPEPLVAEFSLPTPSSLEGKTKILVLDGIRDPGNLGTIIRTALALHWDGVFLLSGCCDLFNEKTISASRGATFTFSFRQGSLEEFLPLAKKEKWPIYKAHIAGEDAHKLGKLKKIALVLGNEAHGISSELEGKEISIPISKKMESLNVAVAAGILMDLL